MSSYSRTHRQPKGDNGSCTNVTYPKMRDSYGYLKETPKCPDRTSYTRTEMLKDSKVFIAARASFDEFKAFVIQKYVGNPDFVWGSAKKKELFELHMQQIESTWPKQLK